jgi:hypothetical protein
VLERRGGDVKRDKERLARRGRVMKEVSLTEILHTLDVWHAETNNDYNDGYVQKGYKDKIAAVRKSLDAKKTPIKFEEIKEEMCF